MRDGRRGSKNAKKGRKIPNNFDNCMRTRETQTSFRFRRANIILRTNERKYSADGKMFPDASRVIARPPYIQTSEESGVWRALSRFKFKFKSASSNAIK